MPGKKQHSMAFRQACLRTLDLEAGFYDDPNGGRTLFGIAERHHPDLWENGPPTRPQAVARYHRDYWANLRLDSLASAPIQFEVFDSGVNCGVAVAQFWLQRSYNALIPDWAPLKEDSRIGPKTVRAINRFCKKSPEWERALVHCCNTHQGMYYLTLRDSTHCRGWFAHRVNYE